MSASARMMASGQRVNGAITVLRNAMSEPARWSATYVSRGWPYGTAGTDTVHIVEQVGTRYRAGVGVIVKIEEIGVDGPFIVDVAPSTALVEWEGAE